MGVSLVSSLPIPFQAFPTHNVCAQFNKEDGDAAKGEGDADSDVNQIGGQLWDVLRQGVGNGFLEIVKDETS